MPESNELKVAIRQIFCERLFIEIPDNDTDLLESGILDSLTLVGLLAQLESEYGITVDMDALDIDDFRSIHRIADYVARSKKDSHVDHA